MGKIKDLVSIPIMLAVSLVFLIIITHEILNDINEFNVKRKIIASSLSVGVVSLETKTDTIAKKWEIGSCFIAEWEKQKIIATDFHIIKNSKSLVDSLYKLKILDSAKTTIYYHFEFPGDFIYHSDSIFVNSLYDLAIIIPNVPNDSLPPPLSLGDSNETQILDEVFAIGKHGKIRNVITKGTVINPRLSGLELYIPETINYIFSDAIANYGSSGGVLLNKKGKVIGINNALYTQNLLVLSVPVNYLKTFLLLKTTNDLYKLR